MGHTMRITMMSLLLFAASGIAKADGNPNGHVDHTHLVIVLVLLMAVVITATGCLYQLGYLFPPREKVDIRESHDTILDVIDNIKLSAFEDTDDFSQDYVDSDAVSELHMIEICIEDGTELSGVA